MKNFYCGAFQKNLNFWKKCFTLGRKVQIKLIESKQLKHVNFKSQGSSIVTFISFLRDEEIKVTIEFLS